MPYPQKSLLSRPCPSCDSLSLFRKTVDPEKPLGVVACGNCAFTSPIKDFVEAVKVDVMAKAQERLDNK
jgi:transcription elongation factor Elf1